MHGLAEIKRANEAATETAQAERYRDAMLRARQYLQWALEGSPVDHVNVRIALRNLNIALLED